MVAFKKTFTGQLATPSTGNSSPVRQSPTSLFTPFAHECEFTAIRVCPQSSSKVFL